MTAIDLVAHVSPLFTVLRPARAFTKTSNKQSIKPVSLPSLTHHTPSSQPHIMSDRSIHIHTFGLFAASIHPFVFPHRSIDRWIPPRVYICKTYLRLSRWVSQPPPSSRSCPVQSRRKVKTSVNHSDAPNASTFVRSLSSIRSVYDTVYTYGFGLWLTVQLWSVVFGCVLRVCICWYFELDRIQVDRIQDIRTFG